MENVSDETPPTYIDLDKQQEETQRQSVPTMPVEPMISIFTQS